MVTGEEIPGHFPEENVDGQTPPGNEADMDPPPDYGLDSYQGTGKLKGKISLITGADSGIGRAIALHFAREGAHVAIAYWKEHDDAKQTQKVCEEAGVETILIPGDLSEEKQCSKVVDDTVAKWGKIDILVNNAAFQGPALDSFLDIERSRIEFTFRVNILAYISVAQKAVRHMSKGSSIIDVCSIQAVQPHPGIIDYASTKGAIITFTKGASQELASKGIRINSIAPGPIWTPLVVASFPKDMIKDFGSNMAPMGRAGMPKEFGPTAVFLADDKQSSYITGAVIPVTGGMLM